MSSSLPDTPWPDPFLATVGVFDGVHRGHQEILRLLRAESKRRGLPIVLVTFDRRPITLLQPGTEADLLTPPPRKWRLLAEQEVDRIVVLRFTSDFSMLSPEDFLEGFLRAGAGLAGLWVGPDFRFGHERRGDGALLAEWSSRCGFTYTSVDPVLDDGAPISSSRIRKHLRAGDVDRAAELLGRWPDIEGRVVQGRGEGAKLLVPTANLSMPAGACLPGTGVYAGYAEWDGAWHPAVLNVGRRPTLTRSPDIVPEVHVLDWEGDLRGRRLLFQLRSRLREERKFQSLSELRSQVGNDVAAARRLLGQTPADSRLAQPPNSC